MLEGAGRDLYSTRWMLEALTPPIQTVGIGEARPGTVDNEERMRRRPVIPMIDLTLDLLEVNGQQMTLWLILEHLSTMG